MLHRHARRAALPALLLPALLLLACDDAAGPEPTSDPDLVKALSAGGSHTCALTNDGKLHCWGEGGSGQLGQGGFGDRFEPAPVTGIGQLGLLAVSAGLNHTCAVTLSGTTFCWGQGSAGALGNGTRASQWSPSQAAGPEFGSIHAGWASTCGLTSDGIAHCWGSNLVGALGDGTREVGSSRSLSTPRSDSRSSR